jgi:hypothetical protein
MGAPRRYSDEQRLAMYALYEQGCKPAEISRRCEAGLASCAPFSIARTSVRDIVAAMARERRGSEAPVTLADVEGGDAIKDFPQMAAQIVSDEGARIKAKQPRQGLNLADLNKLAKLDRLAAQIRRTMIGPGRTAPAATGNGGSNGQSSPTLERLAAANGSDPA